MNNSRSHDAGEQEFEKQFKEIQDLLNCPESKQIFNSVKGQDIAIFIGNTRSGKSTLINHAIGNKLKAVKMSVMPFALTLVKANDQEQGPIIGLESVSETTLPSIWSASKSGLREKVVDAPGFEDNRGEAQDIANTFYIKEIIRNAKSVKFVLITDINDIMSQNINNFTSFIDKMHRIFPDTRVLHGGIALVFSKEKGTFTVENICSFFNRNILDQTELKVEKSLIKYFTDNKECIAFFKMPASEGLLTGADIGNGILDIIGNKLKGIPGRMLSDVKPGISDKSKVFLLQSYTGFCNGVEYLDLLQKVKDSFVKKCMEMSRVDTGAEAARLSEVMSQMESKLLQLFPQDGPLTFANVIEKLGSLCEMCGIRSQMDNSNITVHIQFVEFLDQMLNLNNGEIYTDKLRGTVEIIKTQFGMARLISETIQKKISQVEAEKRKRKIAEEHSKEMKKLVEKMIACNKENHQRATEQAKKLGFFGKVGKFGKDVFNSAGTLIGGAVESLGETLDEAKDFFSSMFK